MHCPDDDGNACTEPVCVLDTGACAEQPVAGMRKCAGACCLPNATCAELAAASCADAGGAWLDSATRCASISCPTPAPPPTTTTGTTSTTSTGIASVPTAPPTTVLIDERRAAYARSLCRVLTECGDGDEEPCLSDARAPECVRLRCCAVHGV